jgi:hypothetical protein
VFSRRSARSSSPLITKDPGSQLSRRQLLAGGVGVGALLALPDLPRTGQSAAASEVSGDAPAGFAFVYGTPDAGQAAGGSVAATPSPGPAAAPLVTLLPQSTAAQSIPVATQLAATPVASPDQATVALVTVDNAPGEAEVTLTLVDAASATVSGQGSVTVTGIPDGTNILATPVFAPGTKVVALVLAITQPTGTRPVRKADPRGNGTVTRMATTWRSHHALAYFDAGSGTMTGPFHLADEPSLALSTVAASSSDVFIWTTREPQPNRSAKGRIALPLPQVSAFPLGSARARLAKAAPGPWPGGEPVATLPSGDVARLVNGRVVQVCSARTGDVAQQVIEPISAIRAKPSAVTMDARPDGTVFITKPGIGRAVVADPAHSFRVTAQVSFPVPASPLGAPWSKAVLSPSGDTLYVLGSASAGGVSAYEVATGALTASYTEGQHYSGLYQLASGTLLATAAANPRLAFFSPALSPLGTADTNLHVSAVF